MNQTPDETRSWDEPQGDPDQAVDEMRRSLQRVREQVRDYRRAMNRDTGDEA